MGDQTANACSPGGRPRIYVTGHNYACDPITGNYAPLRIERG